MPKRRAESRKGMIVTTIALPPELHKKLAIAAIEDGAASAEIIRVAVTEWLTRRTRDKRGR
jgi:predicted transcriptional regulator